MLNQSNDYTTQIDNLLKKLVDERAKQQVQSIFPSSPSEISIKFRNVIINVKTNNKSVENNRKDPALLTTNRQSPSFCTNSSKKSLLNKSDNNLSHKKFSPKTASTPVSKNQNGRNIEELNIINLRDIDKEQVSDGLRIQKNSQKHSTTNNKEKQLSTEEVVDQAQQENIDDLQIDQNYTNQIEENPTHQYEDQSNKPHLAVPITSQNCINDVEYKTRYQRKICSEKNISHISKEVTENSPRTSAYIAFDKQTKQSLKEIGDDILEDLSLDPHNKSEWIKMANQVVNKSKTIDLSQRQSVKSNKKRIIKKSNMDPAKKSFLDATKKYVSKTTCRRYRSSYKRALYSKVNSDQNCESDNDEIVFKKPRIEEYIDKNRGKSNNLSSDLTKEESSCEVNNLNTNRLKSINNVIISNSNDCAENICSNIKEKELIKLCRVKLQKVQVKRNYNLRKIDNKTNSKSLSSYETFVKRNNGKEVLNDIEFEDIINCRNQITGDQQTNNGNKMKNTDHLCKIKSKTKKTLDEPEKKIRKTRNQISSEYSGGIRHSSRQPCPRRAYWLNENTNIEDTNLYKQFKKLYNNDLEPKNKNKGKLNSQKPNKVKSFINHRTSISGNSDVDNRNERKQSKKKNENYDRNEKKKGKIQIQSNESEKVSDEFLNKEVNEKEKGKEMNNGKATKIKRHTNKFIDPLVIENNDVNHEDKTLKNDKIERRNKDKFIKKSFNVPSKLLRGGESRLNSDDVRSSSCQNSLEKETVINLVSDDDDEENYGTIKPTSFRRTCIIDENDEEEIETPLEPSNLHSKNIPHENEINNFCIIRENVKNYKKLEKIHSNRNLGKSSKTRKIVVVPKLPFSNEDGGNMKINENLNSHNSTTQQVSILNDIKTKTVANNIRTRSINVKCNSLNLTNNNNHVYNQIEHATTPDSGKFSEDENKSSRNNKINFYGNSAAFYEPHWLNLLNNKRPGLSGERELIHKYSKNVENIKVCVTDLNFKKLDNIEYAYYSGTSGYVRIPPHNEKRESKTKCDLEYIIMNGKVTFYVNDLKINLTKFVNFVASSGDYVKICQGCIYKITNNEEESSLLLFTKK